MVASLLLRVLITDRCHVSQRKKMCCNTFIFDTTVLPAHFDFDLRKQQEPIISITNLISTNYRRGHHLHLPSQVVHGSHPQRAERRLGRMGPTFVIFLSQSTMLVVVDILPDDPSELAQYAIILVGGFLVVKVHSSHLCSRWPDF
jgi:hypothetical protein